MNRNEKLKFIKEISKDNEQYHLYYLMDINKKVVNLVRDLIKQKKYYRLNDDDKQKEIIELSKQLSNIYNVKKPTITFNKNYSFYGSYNTIDNEIILKNNSLISFLHEFKHLIQHQKGLINNELKSISFSHTLFFIATPLLFIKSIKQNKIAYQKDINIKLTIDIINLIDDKNNFEKILKILKKNLDPDHNKNKSVMGYEKREKREFFLGKRIGKKKKVITNKNFKNFSSSNFSSSKKNITIQSVMDDEGSNFFLDKRIGNDNGYGDETSRRSHNKIKSVMDYRRSGWIGR